MDQITAIVYKLFDIGLIVVGFGLVIFIHELGHFVAAKWAKVRVLAFAIGFGNAMVSYRKGFGFRKGSSEAEYNEWLVRKADGATAPEHEVSPTEYRLNTLPLGGYVKMLGQDDAHPTYRNEEPDSYSSVPVWKRMIIISAGVTMNVITAALLYVAVFMAGLQTEPPIVGGVAMGSPAATATLINADALGILEVGLQPGDLITSINGDAPASFNDVILTTAMAKGKSTLDFRVQRAGYEDELAFEMTPVMNEMGLQAIGVGPAYTTTLRLPSNDAETELFRSVYDTLGIGDVPFGSKLISINGLPVANAAEFGEIVWDTKGEPAVLEFAHADQNLSIQIPTRPVLDGAIISIAGTERYIEHISGIMPVMQVGPFQDETMAGYEQGLREGDIFVRLGATSYPDQARGVTEVSARAGNIIDATVLRTTDAGTELIDLELKVTRKGTIGFNIAGTHEHTYLALPKSSDDPLPTDTANMRPGSRILTIADRTVTSFADIQSVLQSIVVDGQATEILIVVELPIKDDAGKPIRSEVMLALSAEQSTHIAQMGWRLPLDQAFFSAETTTLRADGPISAIGMGMHETKRVMTNTYLTFLRLFEGSVSPRNLNGPVGIVHIGTVVASRGFIWLLFFFALVNINLAVINFLPIPITDGGHMIFLVWEQLTGKPVSIAVQNAATLVGLVMIVAVFLFVTYNDISRLLGL